MQVPEVGASANRLGAGGTAFDSSDIYQAGQAESVLGELLGPDRDDFVVITKYSGTKQKDRRPGTTGNSRKTMIRSLEASLTRLKTDYVDVFMPHFPDGVTPMEEILTGLDHLIQSGKVLHCGFSNFPAWRIAGAAVQADLRDSLRPSGLRPSTAWPNVPPTANSCRWPKPTASGCWCIHRWPAGCSPESTGGGRQDD